MHAPANTKLKKKVAKLAEQKRASDELNSILTREGGLIATSTKTMKNLDVAVVVSKRPGYFDYYKVCMCVRVRVCV